MTYRIRPPTGERPEQDKMSGGDLDGDTCKLPAAHPLK